MLRVPWTKVWSIRDRLLQVLPVLEVFGLYVLLDTARTRSISGLCTEDTAILAVPRGPILLVLHVLAIFGPSVLLLL